MVTAGKAVLAKHSLISGGTACAQPLRCPGQLGSVAVILCWVFLLSGCDLLRITEPPLDPPEITGVIMRVDLDPPRGQGLRQLLIDEDPAPGTPETCRSAYFAVSSAAILIRQPDGSWRRGRKEDLRVGAVASGWYKKGSLVLDSCPRQGEASVIAILEPGLQ